MKIEAVIHMKKHNASMRKAGIELKCMGSDECVCTACTGCTVTASVFAASAGTENAMIKIRNAAKIMNRVIEDFMEIKLTLAVMLLSMQFCSHPGC